MANAKRTIQRTRFGTHIVADFFGCKNLDNLNFIRRSLRDSARVCGATVLHAKFHKFSPKGITGYILLAESHISIHTWPEYRYAAVDVFTCGPMDTRRAISYLSGRLGARVVEMRSIDRGAGKAARCGKEGKTEKKLSAV